MMNTHEGQIETLTEQYNQPLATACWSLHLVLEAMSAKTVRDKMDGDVIIEGFSKESIMECSMKYLGSQELSVKMLQQAQATGIYALLHIPIILVMTVVVFLEEDSLPKTKTGIYKTIYRLAMDRTTLKTFGCKSADISNLEDLLYTLGEFSWKALQSDVQQLLLDRVRRVILI